MHWLRTRQHQSTGSPFYGIQVLNSRRGLRSDPLLHPLSQPHPTNVYLTTPSNATSNYPFPFGADKTGPPCHPSMQADEFTGPAHHPSRGPVHQRQVGGLIIDVLGANVFMEGIGGKEREESASLVPLRLRYQSLQPGGSKRSLTL